MPLRDRGAGPISSYCVQFSPSHSQVSLNRVAVLLPAPPNRTTRLRAASNTIATSERAGGPTSCFCVHKSCGIEPSLSLPTFPSKLFLVITKIRHALKRRSHGPMGRQCELFTMVETAHRAV